MKDKEAAEPMPSHFEEISASAESSVPLERELSDLFPSSGSPIFELLGTPIEPALYRLQSYPTTYRLLTDIGEGVSRADTTLERLERKLDALRNEVARREDIIAQKNEILASLEHVNESLTSKLDTLRKMQANNVAHKRLARYSLMFFGFFSFSFVVRLFTDTVVVDPFWNDVGLLISFAFYVMSFFMKLDWKRAFLKK